MIYAKCQWKVAIRILMHVVCMCLGPGIAVNSISVCSAFCATGSEDGFLRLWPLDFSSVFLEAGQYQPSSLTSTLI